MARAVVEFGGADAGAGAGGAGGGPWASRQQAWQDVGAGRRDGGGGGVGSGGTGGLVRQMLEEVGQRALAQPSRCGDGALGWAEPVCV